MLLAALILSAQAQDVAITEFINNPNGPEPGAEWIELYNYGSVDIDLTDWAIADEDADFDLIPSGIIPAGGYLILSNDPATFVAEWSVGTVGVDVVEVPWSALANGDDEIILQDPAGGVVWSLAYEDDEFAGYSTWLTDVAFSENVFGNQTFPGVDRAGDDNSAVGYAGYQDGSITADTYAVTSVSGDVASPFDGPYGGVVANPQLNITGTCPGPVTVRATNMTPGGAVAVLTGNGPGNNVIPAGPCAGLNSNLSGLAFRGLYSANGNGVFSVSPNLGAAFCGAGVQMLDVSSCTLTNVALIP